MTNEKKISSYRLLEALDCIDDSFIAHAAICKFEQTEALPAPDKKKGWLSLRRFAALAACLVLISVVVPVAHYVAVNMNSLLSGWFGSTGSTELTAEETNKLETEYPLTKEELDAINEAWAKEKGADEKFAESIEELKSWKFKICPVEYGNCVFGKYGEVIVLCRHMEKPGAFAVNVSDYEFWFKHKIEMWACKDKTYYTVQEAFENGYLSEDNLSELYSIQNAHNNVYRLEYDENRTRSYLEFIPELEPLNAQEMKDVENAYISFYYDSQYMPDYEVSINSGKNEYLANFLADSVAQQHYKLAINKLFRSDSYAKYRYYGVINDCIIFAVQNDQYAIKSYNIGGQEIYFPEKSVLYIYQNNEVIPLVDAYSNGLLSENDIAEIASRHKEYNKFLNIDDTKPVSTVIPSEPEYLKFTGVEHLEKEEMIEIRGIWAQYWYDQSYASEFASYKDKCTEAVAHQLAIEASEGIYNESYFELFNPEQYHYVRYLGKFNGYVVLTKYSAFGCAYQFGDDNITCDSVIKLYKNGTIYEIKDCYENSTLTIEDIKMIFYRMEIHKDAALQYDYDNSND